MAKLWYFLLKLCNSLRKNSEWLKVSTLVILMITNIQWFVTFCKLDNGSCKGFLLYMQTKLQCLWSIFWRGSWIRTEQKYEFTFFRLFVCLNLITHCAIRIFWLSFVFNSSDLSFHSVKFFLQFPIDILTFGSGSGSRNPKCCESNGSGS